jgi:hypothetical protein
MDVWHFEKQGAGLNGYDLPPVISLKNSAKPLVKGLKDV